MEVLKYFTNCIAVFQGGGCKAIAYVGAFEKAYNEGVFFSELAGTSAGSVIAALIAAGATPDYLKNLINTIDFREFKRPCGKGCWPARAFISYQKWKDDRKDQNNTKTFLSDWHDSKPYSWKALNSYLGFFDSQVVEEKMQVWLRDLTGKNNVTFADLAPNLHIVATDVVNKSVTEWNKEDTPDFSVAKAVRASCSIPIYFTPTDRKWVDGGLMSNCPDFIFGDDPNFYQMLTFRLRSEERGDVAFDDFIDYGKQLANTIVEGADNLQHTFIFSPNEITIKTGVISATDFDKITPEVTVGLMNAGAMAMQEFLENKEAEYREKQNQGLDDFWPRAVLRHKEQMYSMLSYWGFISYSEVIVCCEDTSWSWSIFPTLMGWINNGAKIVVYVDRNAPVDNRESSRRRMLNAMGCLVVLEDAMPFKGFFFLNGNGGRGVVYSGADETFLAKIYCDTLDGHVMKGWIETLKTKAKLDELEPQQIGIKPVVEQEIISRLCNDKFYRKSEMHFETVPLKDILFLNSTIRSLKYKHIYHMFEMYRKAGIEPFRPAALIFRDGRESLIGPPVVERHDGKLYVIEGNTRCLYAYKHGISALTMLVVDGVTAEMPVEDPGNSYPIDKVIITEREIKAKDRYKGFNYGLFRHIEQCLRPYDTYMTS